MPNEAQQAVDWALTQTDSEGSPITKDTPHTLVDKIREYFNTHSITYNTFSFNDLEPYLGGGS